MASKSQQSLEIALDVLKEGHLLGIYPEGTRSPDGYLYRGRTGVARLALVSGASVIPVGLVGTEEVMPKDAKLPRLWGRVQGDGASIGKPLDFSRFEGQEQDRFALRSVTDEIVYEIMQLSGQQYRDEYASKKATEPLPESIAHRRRHRPVAKRSSRANPSDARKVTPQGTSRAPETS